MNLVLLGAPGSGKGTQGEVLSTEYGLKIVSTGDMLRAEVRSESAVGKRIKEHMNAGELVPDSVVIDLIRNRLAHEDSGFVLDGYPRNRAQAEALAGILSELGKDLDEVVFLKVEEDELVKRLGYRRSCSQCGAVYHLKAKPPAAEGLCDKCGGDLYRREDDEPDAIRRRFEVYMKETAPLVSFYEDAGLLHVIDGAAPAKEIREELRLIMSADGSRPEERGRAADR
ncbi:MAG: adenylate kinase [Terriglobia bacterium]